MNYLLLMLAVFINAAQAITNQEYFLKGNQAYKQEAYAQAIEHYNAIKHKNSAVWCNMGLAYHAQKDDQNALYCWYKALEQASGKTAYHINRLLQEQEATNPDQLINWRTRMWKTWVRPLVYGMPLGIIQGIFIFMLCIVGLLSWYTRLRARKWTMIVMSFGLLIVGSLLALRYQSMHTNYAIIAAQAPLFIGPDESYYQSGQTKSPALVRILAMQNGWAYVTQGPNRNWVATSFIKPLSI